MSRELKDELKGISFFESHCPSDDEVLKFTRAFAAACDRHNVRRMPQEWLADPAAHAAELRRACAANFAFAADLQRLLCADASLAVIREADMEALLTFLSKHAGAALAVQDLMGPRVLTPLALDAFAKVASDCFGDLVKAASIVARQSFAFGGVTRQQVRDIVMPSRMCALLDESTRELLNGPAGHGGEQAAMLAMLERLQAEVQGARQRKGAAAAERDEDSEVAG